MVKKKHTLTLSLSCLLFLFSCTFMRQGIAVLRTPHGFTGLGNNVQIENRGDSVFGKSVRDALPALIDSVEKKELHKFIESPAVYLCKTNSSFCSYAGSKYPGPRAKVTPKGLFISPRLQGSKDWKEIVYHELSHVILLKYTGLFHYIKIPIWFHEGLATSISNGGGSGDVTDSAAISEIVKGNHFYPVANENILFPKSFSNSVRPWMHYRQAMLFVGFLKEGKEKEFENLLDSVFRKKSFSKSIETSYGVKLPVLWNEFLEQLKARENRAGAPIH